MEARQLENGVVVLLLDLGAPIPSGGEAPVDARARVKEVVSARAVEGMPEEVHQDGFPAFNIDTMISASNKIVIGFGSGSSWIGCREMIKGMAVLRTSTKDGYCVF